jgi:predicted Rossmann fold nucleotide-binding protein DprA/Smf involved in DNA uptake
LRIAIIGSRDFPDLDMVRRYVQKTPLDSTIVTGGAIGVDQAAEEEARRVRRRRHIIEPIILPGMSRKDYIAALFARNREIVDSSERIVGFWTGLPGGTQFGLEYAEKLGKEVEVIELPF